MFQLINNDAGFFRAPQVELRTTELPGLIDGSLVYESCLFTCTGSDVLASHTDIEQAIRFHRVKSRDLGLTNIVQT